MISGAALAEEHKQALDKNNQPYNKEIDFVGF
jgi:hypothetical protein